MTISPKKRANLLEELQQDFAKPNETTPPATGKTSKKQKVSFHFEIDKKLHKELKQLALNDDSDIKSLIMEGLKSVLKKRGKNINDYLE